MKSEFPRVITLLRKERNISQKQAAAELGISQALLSHYEKGIRECGLGFLVRCADFYGVSCDYLLGRSAERDGGTITVDDIPEPDMGGKDNVGRGSVLPVLNKKLIANSLNIMFDQLGKIGDRELIGEVSTFMMLSVYRMFRLVYSANPKNQQSMFSLPKDSSGAYARAVMELSEAHVAAITQSVPGASSDARPLTTEELSQQYPLFASSLLNLVKNAEGRISSTLQNQSDRR